MHEASLWRDNCFVTLTYGRDQLPAFGSLDHRDFQLFMKRVRKYSETPVRFYMSGEYGPQNSRPHYHSSFSISISMTVFRQVSRTLVRFSSNRPLSTGYGVWGMPLFNL